MTMSIKTVFSKQRGPLWFGAALGFFATVTQIALVREFLVVQGASELSLGMLLANWLVAIGVGAWLARVWDAASGRMHRYVAALLVCIPAALLSVRFYEYGFSIPAGGIMSPLQLFLLSVVCSFPCGSAVGFLFTAAARRWCHRQVASVNELYISEAIGAAAAGLLVPLVFTSVIGSTTMVFLAIFLLAVAVPVSISRHRSVTAVIVPVLAGVCGAGAYLCDVDAYTFGAAFSLRQERGTLQHCADTHYNRVCIGKNKEQFQVYAGGTLQYVFPDRYLRPIPVLAALATHPRPKRVLLVGGGIPEHVEAALQFDVGTLFYFDVDEIAYREVLPYVEFGTRHAMNLPNVHTAFGSVRRFLQAHGDFDVIIDFSFSIQTAADHSTHTQTYFTLIRKALSADGVYIQITEGSANVFSAPAAALLANEQATLRSVFPHVHLLTGVQSYWLASAEPLTLSADVITRRLFRQLGEQASLVPATDIFNTQRNRMAAEQLSRLPGIVNRDTRPSGFVNGLRLRHLAQTAGLQEPSTDSPVSSGWVLLVSILAAVLFGTFAVVRRGRTPTSDGAASIATTGMAAMGAELVVLYLFSVTWGGLYFHVAGLLATFMAGAALGAVVGRVLASRFAAGRIADGVTALLLGGCALVFWIPQLPQFTFYVLMMLLGAGTGMAFPVFFQQFSSTHVESAPWKIEFADHLGAALGAVAVSLVWLPYLGITWTCVLLFFFKVPLLIKKDWKKTIR
ncbi:MAG: hypothetical protein JXX29_15885 [Deltaproteobacteria bacterium]|nr:hypothetical protein [Deltaproteobacteria bacterium]MBN2673162.1 hypothetical protein [Deltaproteobacteria bacterium]